MAADQGTPRRPACTVGQGKSHACEQRDWCMRIRPSSRSDRAGRLRRLPVPTRGRRRRVPLVAALRPVTSRRGGMLVDRVLNSVSSPPGVQPARHRMKILGLPLAVSVESAKPRDVPSARRSLRERLDPKRPAVAASRRSWPTEATRASRRSRPATAALPAVTRRRPARPARPPGHLALRPRLAVGPSAA
jgi:hypothetical protein